MSIARLDPPIPLWTPKGTGLAHLIIDYGIEHHLMWVVALDDNGEFWTLPNPTVRAQWNESCGRKSI